MISSNPLLPGVQAESLTNETNAGKFHRMFEMLVDRRPGKPWVKSPHRQEISGISLSIRVTALSADDGISTLKPHEDTKSTQIDKRLLEYNFSHCSQLNSAGIIGDWQMNCHQFCGSHCIAFFSKSPRKNTRSFCISEQCLNIVSCLF